MGERMNLHHPTPFETIELSADAFGQLIDTAKKTNERSLIALQHTKLIAEHLSEAVREHEDAAQANESVGRTMCARAHQTLAQRLAAAADFISSGKLEIG